MLVLTIETSCDETAAAVVRDGRQVLANVVASQVAEHALYGGVVPEIASRRHLESVTPVVATALEQAGVTLADIAGIGVTRGPGLPGALLVGVTAARALGMARGIPVVPLHHQEGHILAPFLEEPLAFPFLALAVSGGHTHLYRVEGIGRYVTLGQTVDDAAGEAFDKVAKLVGLPYPGGMEIDRLAASGDPAALHLPRPMLHEPGYAFSFSGLKTAVLTQVRRRPELATGRALHDLCASFQAAVCEVLVTKTFRALAETGLSRLVVSGGVACNSGLRRAMADAAARAGIQLAIPAPALCTDNAAMLAVAADHYLLQGLGKEPFDALPNWRLDEACGRVAEGGA